MINSFDIKADTLEKDIVKLDEEVYLIKKALVTHQEVIDMQAKELEYLIKKIGELIDVTNQNATLLSDILIKLRANK